MDEPNPEAERQRAEAAEAEVARLKALLAQRKAAEANPEQPAPSGPPELTPVTIPAEPPEDPAVRLRRILKRVPMYAFIVFVGWVVAEQLFPGEKVIVENKGPGEMRGITVKALGQERTIERIGAGESAFVYFRVSGVGTLVIEYKNAADKPVHLEMGQQFSGSRGTIRVRVRADRLQPVPLGESS